MILKKLGHQILIPLNYSVSQKPRLFLVGCPRSGTTLLQSLLAAHPEIASFPESHFFRHLLRNRSSWRTKLRIAAPTARQKFEQFLEEVGHPELKSYLPQYALFTVQYVQAFIKVLDHLTQQQNKQIWLEKTPGHLHYISYIQQRVAGAKFIHLIRNGEDVIASLYEVSHQYPEIWTGAWDIDRCIQQWVQDVNKSLTYLNKSHHFLVRYEDLVKNPTQCLENLCQFIGIEFQDDMLKNYSVASRSLVLKNEPWKFKVEEPINRETSSKFYTLFNEQQRNYILQQISSVKL